MDHLPFVRHINAVTVFNPTKRSSLRHSVTVMPAVTRAGGELPPAILRRSKTSLWRRRDDVSLAGRNNSNVLDRSNRQSTAEDAAMAKNPVDQEAEETCRKLQRGSGRFGADSVDSESHGKQGMACGEEAKHKTANAGKLPARKHLEGRAKQWVRDKGRVIGRGNVSTSAYVHRETWTGNHRLSLSDSHDPPAPSHVTAGTTAAADTQPAYSLPAEGLSAFTPSLATLPKNSSSSHHPSCSSPLRTPSAPVTASDSLLAARKRHGAVLTHDEVSAALCCTAPSWGNLLLGVTSHVAWWRNK